MYISYWNFRENPFQSVADTRFAYLSDQHREALARLLFLVEGRKLGGVLVGPFGVGKSMILELLADKVRQRGGIQFLHVDASSGSSLALAKIILRRLGCVEPVADVASAVEMLAQLCVEGRTTFSYLVLALDEAHLLQDAGAMEFLHLLTNVRTRRADGSLGGPAVTLLLSGHPELLEKTAADGALCQRLQLTWELKPFQEAQTAEYVHFRIRVAGGDIWAFEPDSLVELHQASGGLPRIINNICDIALVLGASVRAPRVSIKLMRQAALEARATSLRDMALQGAQK